MTSREAGASGPHVQIAFCRDGSGGRGFGIVARGKSATTASSGSRASHDQHGDPAGGHASNAADHGSAAPDHHPLDHGDYSGDVNHTPVDFDHPPGECHHVHYRIFASGWADNYEGDLRSNRSAAKGGIGFHHHDGRADDHPGQVGDG